MENLKTLSTDITTPITITGISHEGRGIAHINGKITFIENALPGEVVQIVYNKKRRSYDEAKAIKIESNRVVFIMIVVVAAAYNI